MSATAPRPVAVDDVYARMFRDGRSEVLAVLRREFPRYSAADIEDVASTAMLEMVRSGRITTWSTGAIGQWLDLARLRMVDELRRPARRTQFRTVSECEIPDNGALPSDVVEREQSEWRAVELMAQLSDRAATYVRLRILEGGRRVDVIAATNWSQWDYEAAQREAKAGLRSALHDLDSAGRCERFRDLIDATAVAEELPLRKRVELRAHTERCSSCRAYRRQAHQTVRGVAPLVGLLLPASGGTAWTLGGALGATGAAAPAGLLGKGLVTLCIGVACVGGAITIADGPRPRAQAAKPSQQTQGPVADSGVAGRQSPAPGPKRRPRAIVDDQLGLDAFQVQGPGASRERTGDDEGAEAAFGLGTEDPSSTRSSSARSPDTGGSATASAAPTCSPGELGC